jgi:ferredoxin
MFLSPSNYLQNSEIAMAEKSKILPKNVLGRFYVDETCIDCEVCREIAPANFTRDDTSRKSYVFAQPDTPADEAACLAAIEECPVEAIGNE